MNRIETCFLYQQDLTPCCGRDHQKKLQAYSETWQFKKGEDFEGISVFIVEGPIQVDSELVSSVRLNPRFVSKYLQFGLHGICMQDDFPDQNFTVRTDIFCYCPLNDGIEDSLPAIRK